MASSARTVSIVSGDPQDSLQSVGLTALAADTDQVRARHTDEDEGFSILEVAIAGAIFMLVSLGFLTMMMAATKTYVSSRDRTLGQEVATEQLEQARRMPWDQLGLVGGNPPGTIPASQTLVVDASGFTVTVATSVSFVNDPIPGGITTGANYKRVKVSVTAAGFGSAPYTAETLIAPPTQASLNAGSISAKVQDWVNTHAIVGATVNVKTGPSATRTDITDASGVATFSALTPTPLTGPQAYYDVDASLSGYVAVPEDTGTNAAVHFHLDPGQPATPVIHLYKPVTLNVEVRDYQGNLSARPGTVSVTSTTRGTSSVALAGGKATITSTTTSGPPAVTIPLIAGITPAYTVKVTLSDGTVLTDTTPIAPGYPTVLSSTFVFPLPAPAMGTLSTTVRSVGLGTPVVPGATVTFTGGPEFITATAVTDVGGVATISLPASTTVPYTVSLAAAPPYGASSVTATVAANVTTNAPPLNVTGPPANGTFLVRLRSTGSGTPAIAGATVTVTGGPSSVTMTAVTDASGIATFTVPATATVVYSASVPAKTPYGAGTVTSLVPPNASTTVDLNVSGP